MNIHNNFCQKATRSYYSSTAADMAGSNLLPGMSCCITSPFAAGTCTLSQQMMSENLLFPSYSFKPIILPMLDVPIQKNSLIPAQPGPKFKNLPPHSQRRRHHLLVLLLLDAPPPCLGSVNRLTAMYWPLQTRRGQSSMMLVRTTRSARSKACQITDQASPGPCVVLTYPNSISACEMSQHAVVGGIPPFTISISSTPGIDKLQSHRKAPKLPRLGFCCAFKWTV